jgi:glutamate:GABA antiporter
MSTQDQQCLILRSERIAGGILPKVLGSFDMIAIFVTIVLWIVNSAVVTGAGPAAYIYWILGLITFLVPGAIVTGQLGLMFPGEGSIYIWTTKAFGSFMGFFAGFCAWWPGVLVLIAASDAVVTLIQNLGSLYHVTLLPDSGSQGLVIILIITISFLLSILRFRLTQNLVNTIFLAYGSTIVLIGMAGLLWLLTGHASNVDLSFQTGKWSLNQSNFTFYGTVILALLGIEVPLNMGVEIKDMRSITRYLIWGSVVVIAAYLIVTLGVMIAVPSGDQANLAAVVEAIQKGWGPPGLFLATIANLFLIGFFVFVATVYNYSFARLIFVSGLDRRLPIVMSKINANKVPWIAMLVQSAIAAFLGAIIFVLAPFAFPSENVANILYEILQAATTVIWCISMVMLFVDVLTIRYKFQELFESIRLVPDWIFVLCSIVGTLASACGVYVIFTSPWTNTSDLTILSTVQWDIWLAGIAVVSLIVAVAVFFIGQRASQSNMTDEALIAEVTR